MYRIRYELKSDQDLFVRDTHQYADRLDWRIAVAGREERPPPRIVLPAAILVVTLILVAVVILRPWF